MSVKQKLLVHTCCAPCLIAPLPQLKEEWEVTLFWYNPNIHPYMEYLRRRDTLKEFAAKEQLPVIWKDEYDLEVSLKNTDGIKCKRCYEMRLAPAARIAAEHGFDAFTSTLLYSKYQKHDLIKSVGESLSTGFGIGFLYQDWRELWQEGIDLSKAADMYRQPYCGCIYSEKERYYKQANVMK